MDRQDFPAKEKVEIVPCHCPFCDQSMDMPYPFCQACGAEIMYCPTCGQPLPRDAEGCPHCAGEK